MSMLQIPNLSQCKVSLTYTHATHPTKTLRVHRHCIHNIVSASAWIDFAGLRARMPLEAPREGLRSASGGCKGAHHGCKICVDHQLNWFEVQP